MNNGQSHRTASTCSNEIQPKFHIVVIYEDGEAGRHAKGLTDKLLLELGCHCDCSRQLWSFDVMAIVNISEAALEAARNADLLIVSTSGERDFPPHIEDWLGQWGWSIEAETPALAALFQHFNNRPAYQNHLFLSMLAHQRGIAYFPHRDFQPRTELVLAERAHLEEASQALSAGEAVLHHGDPISPADSLEHERFPREFAL